jgi:NAD-dependent SIR2 family protein deacetylase
VRLIKKSDWILIGSGAGMGKDSGLPDFRGN